jgi:hypothetical protein
MTLDQVDSRPWFQPARRPSELHFDLRRPHRRRRRDPLPILTGALARMRAYPQIELIWASPRELFNIVQAERHRLPHHHRHARSAEEASRCSAATSPSTRSTP